MNIFQKFMMWYGRVFVYIHLIRFVLMPIINVFMEYIILPVFPYVWYSTVVPVAKVLYVGGLYSEMMFISARDAVISFIMENPHMNTLTLSTFMVANITLMLERPVLDAVIRFIYRLKDFYWFVGPVRWLVMSYVCQVLQDRGFEGAISYFYFVILFLWYLVRLTLYYMYMFEDFTIFSIMFVVIQVFTILKDLLLAILTLIF